MLHSCENVSTSGAFFHNFSLKIALSRFLFPLSNEFGLRLSYVALAQIQTSNPNNVQWYWKLRDVNFLQTLFFSCRTIAAIYVFVTLKLSNRTISPERSIATYLWIDLIFKIWHVPFSIVKDSLIANEIIAKLFDT